MQLIVGTSAISQSFLHGDFNRDGHVNSTDIPAMLSALADLNAYKSTHALSDSDLLTIGDVDEDSNVTNADAQLTLLKSGMRRFLPVPRSLALGASLVYVGTRSEMGSRSARIHYFFSALDFAWVCHDNPDGYRSLFGLDQFCCTQKEE